MMEESPQKESLSLLISGLIGAVVMLLLVSLWNGWVKSDRYLSDLGGMTVVKSEWKDPRLDVTVDGNNLIIGEKFYAKGIGMHAFSEISFILPRGYTRFVADVGVDDEISEENPASVTFKVVGDGVVLGETPVLTAGMPPFRVNLNVAGVETLNLIVTEGGDSPNSDHGDWGAARLVQR